ncbi:Bcr/CflA family multidrug efflux MFS transporter [Roseomonas sp. 18066]|uniref:Bcr/CflA family multidrug efflux MFS transporter n=1 Tax=Roseomonas sp. 18066 TaxID=2681412 RepID=UPI00135AFA3F|nr:Bcr/CflA family multidrug efflux MFS transporter [Roseomonas sp. 18066]
MSSTTSAPAAASLASTPRLVLALSTLMAFGAMSTDMYLPALPALQASLQASPARIQQTLSLFLVGFALAQLVWGPLGDRYGRRRPIMAGVALFMLGSVGCALATTAGEMLAWRLLQAVGACAGPVLARAMVRDLYGRDRAAQILSVLMLVMGVAPLVAPIIGGQLLVFFSWRSIFWVLLGFGALAFAAAWSLKETLPADRRAPLGFRNLVFGYLGLLGDRRFLGYALTGGCFYGGIYTYLAGSPFAYIEFHHVPPEAYGFLFAVNICGMMGLNMVNSRLVPRLGTDRLFRAGLVLGALSGVALALTAGFSWLGLLGLAAPLFVYVSMLGFIVANSVAGALSAYPRKAGQASALLGTMHYGLGGAFSALLGLLADGTPAPMGLLIGVLGVAGLAAGLLVKSER